MRKTVDVDHSSCRATSSRLMPVASRRRWSSMARRPPLRDTILLPDQTQLPGRKYLDWHRTSIFVA
jgi:hypothetical protein